MKQFIPLITYSYTIIVLAKSYLKTAFRCVNETSESLVMFTVTYKTGEMCHIPAVPCIHKDRIH